MGYGHSPYQVIKVHRLITTLSHINLKLSSVFLFDPVDLLSKIERILGPISSFVLERKLRVTLQPLIKTV